MFFNKKVLSVLCVFLCLNIASGLVLADNYEVINPEFDQGMTGWQMITKSDAVASAQIVQNAALSGANAVKLTISNGGLSWGDVELRQLFKLSRGMTYEIRFMAKADTPRQLTATLQNSASPYSIFLKQVVNLTTQASQYGPFIYTCDGDYPSNYLKFSAGTDTTSVYIDKVEIHIVSPPNFNTLQSSNGVHPRLFVDSDKVNLLRQAILPGGTHASLWAELKQKADRILKSSPPVYIYSDNMMWQREVGNSMSTLAAAYLLSQDSKYLIGAKDWALASCSYPIWDTIDVKNKDLATGHQLFGLGVVYDWCYNSLDDTTKQTIKTAILSHGRDMYTAANLPYSWYWNQTWLQNHMWVNITGLTTAGLAIFDETDEVKSWFIRAEYMMNRTMELFGDDGVNHEGYAYGEYGIAYLLEYMELSRKFFNTNMFATPWFQNAPDYFEYLSLPQNSWKVGNRVVDIADSPRNDWYGPDYSFRKLATEYRNGRIQSLANRIDGANLDDQIAKWLNLFWFDPTVLAVSSTSLPTLKHFKNMDIVSARSDWSGKESLVVFKCGPYIGHKAFDANDSNPTVDWGAGHVHPDANNFVIFANNDWLIRDDGYTHKYTRQHNTLLLNGKGQLGEGGIWFNAIEAQNAKTKPYIRKTVSSKSFDHMVGEAAGAYAADLGLNQYTRHLIYMKPDILLVVDDIKTNTAKQMELRFFPEQQAYSVVNGSYMTAGASSKLSLTPLTSSVVTAENVDIIESDQVTSQRLAYRFQNNTDQWRNAVALTWSGNQSQPPQVTLTQSGSNYKFVASNATSILNLSPTKVGGMSVEMAYLNKNTESKSIGGEIELTNDESATQSVTTVMGLYKGNKLMNIIMKQEQIDGSTTRVIPVDITIPNYGETYKVKAFVWSNLVEMQSIFSAEISW